MNYQIINNLQNQWITMFQRQTKLYFDIQNTNNLTKIKYNLFLINHNKLTKNNIIIKKKGNTFNDSIAITFNLLSQENYFFQFTLYYPNEIITLYTHYTSPKLDGLIDISITKNKHTNNTTTILPEEPNTIINEIEDEDDDDDEDEDEDEDDSEDEDEEEETSEDDDDENINMEAILDENKIIWN